MASSDDGSEIENVLFSPTTLTFTLSAMLIGATGTTERQILALLGQGTKKEALKMTSEIFSVMQPGISDSHVLYMDSNRDLMVGGAMKLEKMIDAEQKFSKRKFHFSDTRSSIQLEDFQRFVENAPKVLTKGCGRQYFRGISKIQLHNIESESRSIQSALTFSGKWLTKFEEANSQDSPFYCAVRGTAARAEKYVTLMRKSDHLRYYRSEEMGAQCLEVPYEDGELSMWLFVPVSGWETFEENLSSEFLTDMMEKATPTVVELYLPEFDLPCSHQPIPVLTSLGVSDAFDARLASFDGRVNCGLDFSAMHHVAHIGVKTNGGDENVLPAKAADEMEAGFSVEFRCDEAFLFLVIHKETGAVMLFGRVASIGRSLAAGQGEPTVEENVAAYIRGVMLEQQSG